MQAIRYCPIASSPAPSHAQSHSITITLNRQAGGSVNIKSTHLIERGGVGDECTSPLFYRTSTLALGFTAFFYCRLCRLTKPTDVYIRYLHSPDRRLFVPFAISLLCIAPYGRDWQISDFLSPSAYSIHVMIGAGRMGLSGVQQRRPGSLSVRMHVLMMRQKSFAQPAVASWGCNPAGSKPAQSYGYLLGAEALQHTALSTFLRVYASYRTCFYIGSEGYDYYY